ncbi:MAG: hypothetical protein K9K87_14785 [Desulfotignum sp.]|nr:hypothetical protein [Desulfotignum sp.]
MKRHESSLHEHTAVTWLPKEDLAAQDRERTRRLWDQVGPAFYDYLVVDETHLGTAASYRFIDQLKENGLYG